jgi:hypothetical protein
MHHDPVELVGVTIHHAAEAVAVLLFIGTGAVLAAVWCGAC